MRITFTFIESVPRNYGTIWYLTAPIPVFLPGLEKVIVNEVDLHEPAVRETDKTAKVSQIPFRLARPPAPPKQAWDQQRLIDTSHDTAQTCYLHHRTASGFHTWCRILILQFTTRPYRILNRPNLASQFSVIFHYLAFMGRFVNFVRSACIQGSLTFMPIPTDYLLTVLLLFATVTPRMVWPRFWKRATRGADLVVWYQPVV